MAKYDLTTLYCKHLDRHLTFPLLEFLYNKELYNPKDVLKCILGIVNKTNMIDYTMDTRKRLNYGNDIPRELMKRKCEVLDTLKYLQQQVTPIIEATEILKQSENIMNSNTFVTLLKDDYNFNDEQLERCYTLAKHLYECGSYEESISCLYFCTLVMAPDHKNYLDVLWGKLAAEILTLNWNTALEDLIRLRNYIDANTMFNHVQLLQQRSWLIHWSILIYFNHARGPELILDALLYKPHYLNAIQTLCPYILRYLAMAVIVSDHRDAIKDLIKIIHQEGYNYRDPITEFLECLYINYDFDAARLKLQECQIVIMYDFFIERYLKQFIENARLILFGTFCGIHQCVSLKMIANKLNMELDDAEYWIIKLIHNARLNAKIDSKLGHVIIVNGQYHSSFQYQQIGEKIELITARCKHLTHLLMRSTEQKKGEWKYRPTS